MTKSVRIILLLFILLSALTSCSTRKNNAATRQYQAFITRYNVYYNGDEHYKETLREMEDTYNDDYSRLLPFHPADARKNPDITQPTGDFTRSIEKAQKAIQLRSVKSKPARVAGKSRDAAYKEWMRREEYNPFLHNAWLMMGKSQYNNGNFLGSAATFYYIVKHFSWLPETVTEAKLWQARCYCALNWDFDAENILTKIPESALTTKNLRWLYNTVYATFYLQSSEPTAAIPYIIAAIPNSSSPQKSRLNMLLGQLYSREDKKQLAYNAYKRAASSGAPYRLKLNARILQSEVYTGANIISEVKALKRMTVYNRNKDYLDRIYYAIGNLYMSRRDTINALTNYHMAIDRSAGISNDVALTNYHMAIDRSAGISNDVALSRLAIGNIYFNQRMYDSAQVYYADAVTALPQNYPNYELLKKRSDVLDELATYSRSVTLNDSLLRLAAMDSSSRTKVIDNIITQLNRKEKDEAKRAANRNSGNGASQPMFNNTNSASAPTAFSLNTDDSWYFYNNTTMTAGCTEFQKRWGTRRLEDNWRRHDKTSTSFDNFEHTDTTSTSAESSDTKKGETTAQNINKSNDPHYPEYYLKQLPFTAQERQKANDAIQEGLYNMGLIFKDKLDDYDEAANVWTQLLTRYPDNVYRLDTYFNLYLMYMRINNMAMAEKYRKLILSDFPDTPTGKALTDANYLDKMRHAEAQQEALYEHTYRAYLNNRNDSVHASFREMENNAPLSKLMPRFMFLHALSYAAENNTDDFRTTLKKMVELYPDADAASLANDYLRGLASGRKLHTASANARPMLWEIQLSSDSIKAVTDSIDFDLNPDEPQLFIFIYPTDEVSTNQLLYDVARHNFSAFVVKDFDLETINFGQLGLLLVKGFANFDEAAHYRSMIDGDNKLNLTKAVSSVIISEKNFNTLLQHGASFEQYFKYINQEAEDMPIMTTPPPIDNSYGDDQK